MGSEKLQGRGKKEWVQKEDLKCHITFSVDDMEATTTELKGKGVVFNIEPISMEGGIKVAFFKDPEGVQIELVEYP